MRRAATLCDGYIGGNVPLARVVPVVEELRAAVSDAGRDPAGFRIVCRGAVRLFDEPIEGDDRRPLWGSLDQVRADVDRYRDAGLDELFFELNFDPSIGSVDADPKASMETALHLLETLMWAVPLHLLNILPGLRDSYYYVLESYTTLGEGAVELPERWRLIGPIIAMSGLFTFGWTGSVLVSIMTDFGKLDRSRASGEAGQRPGNGEPGG